MIGGVNDCLREGKSALEEMAGARVLVVDRQPIFAEGMTNLL